jgi:hypothetical protein
MERLKGFIGGIVFSTFLAIAYIDYHGQQLFERDYSSVCEGRAVWTLENGYRYVCDK